MKRDFPRARICKITVYYKFNFYAVATIDSDMPDCG